MKGAAAKLRSIGGYQLIRKLGTGGMAEVYLASQTVRGEEKPIVVKAILPHLAEDDRFVDMFLREARVAAMLDHQNIVSIHDVSVIENRPCIVMEFLCGRDLWTVLQRVADQKGAVPAGTAAVVVAQAAAGLDYAHRSRDRSGRPLDLVHRDISPHNLFLTREGLTKVVDFGIAKSAFQEHRTESGIIKGKIAYMAPEQARGKDVDHRADQFALGVVLWEMVTGQRLFAREDAFQTMSAMFNEETPRPSTVRPVPKPLEDIIMTTLSRSPTGRFSGCDELATELRKWLRTVHAPPEAQLVQHILNDAVPLAEDELFYAADPDLLGEPVSGENRTRSLSVLSSAPPPPPIPRQFSSPPAPIIAPPPARKNSANHQVIEKKKKSKLPIAIAGVALVSLLIGVGFWATSDDEDQLIPVASAPVEVAPVERTGPVEVRFENVPAGVSLMVDGSPLAGAVLRLVPSTTRHHIVAMAGSREVWRYDAIFSESATVTFPADIDVTPRDEPRRTTAMRTTSMRTTSMRTRPSIMRTRTRSSMSTMTSPTMTTPSRMRLGMGIDLSYP